MENNSNKNNNIRLVKTGGRRVTSGADTERAMRAENARERSKASGELQRKIKYQKIKKQQRVKQQRLRTLITLVFIAVLACVLLFMTPIFNIRSVSVDGNYLVNETQLREKLEPLIGENLFRTGSGKIRKSLKEINLVSDAQINKKFFPPSVAVTVTEYVPAASIRIEGKTLLVDEDLRVLTDDGAALTPVPVLIGVMPDEYAPGELIKTGDEEKTEIARTMLSTFNSAGLTAMITEINIDSATDITFRYDDRITAQCGTSLDLEHKLRLFKESIESGELDENASGTFTFTTSGTAEYTP